MGTPYKEAVRIHLSERDFKLQLDHPEWPTIQPLPEGWQRRVGYLERGIDRDPERLPKGPLKEALLRFPSAPLHGLQRLTEQHVDPDPSENLHTYRVLMHPTYMGPIKRIFLMHNGLNEVAKSDLYYQLASHLIAEDNATACILRPFPGHMTRFAFQAFAETPLDRYLWDGSQLFRQFLRHMIETQWLLSAIVRRSYYRCQSGAVLLAGHRIPRCSRLSTEVLAGKMAAAWRQLYRASASSIEKGDDPIDLRAPLDDDAPFREAIQSLRTLLRLEACYPKLDGELGPDDREPALHVLGYSLGGFTAQSVFMSWPFLVSSCVTLLSGGPLRELAPTAFANPEEWQTVLHSLRYELDDALMNHRSRTRRSASGPVAGLDLDLFLYFKRTFYEVFQQEYRGSFQTRLAAFRQRMLFVVGGNDPIVRPRSVLDSGPPGGINLVAIGGLGHFLGDRPQGDEEERQRSFWVPEIGRLVHRFADEAARRHLEERPGTWLDADLQLPPDPDDRATEDDATGDDENRIRRLTVAERLAVEQDGTLPGELFQQCLDDLLARQEKQDGLLFIFRNEVPTLLLDERAIHEHASLLHHDDNGIAAYTRSVMRRREILIVHRKQIAVVLPWNAKRLMKRMDAHPGYPSQAESAQGQLPVTASFDQTWRECMDICAQLTGGAGADSVRVFDGREPLSVNPEPGVDLRRLLDTAKSWTGKEDLLLVPSLPDCWVWMSRDLLGIGDDDPLTIANGRRKLCNVAADHCDQDSTALADKLRKEDLRIVTVSRARYNPRYRGRIVADLDDAKELFLHVALCAAASVPLAAFDLDAGRPRAELAAA